MSEQPADPSRTYALVVGIEKYDAGNDWDLDGPVADALEFYQWLLARNVPRENIHLLLSPLEANLPQVEQFAIKANAATSTQIRDAFNTLHDQKGDLLFIFWAGHGVISPEQERRVFYADAKKDDKRNLDLDSLLISLGSSYFAGIRRQILIIDACANYAEEMLWAFKLPAEKLPVGEPLATNEQFVFLAARSGQIAKNLGKEKRGLFSQRVLQQISQTPAEKWPPDMRILTERVQAEFAALRASGEAVQAPVYFWNQNWDGSSIKVHTAATGKTGEVQSSELWTLDPSQMPGLLEVLAACPTMMDANSRQDVLNQLGSGIAGGVRHNAAGRVHVLNILTTASRYPGALAHLLRVVEMLEAGSPEWKKVEEVATKALPGFRTRSEQFAEGAL